MNGNSGRPRYNVLFAPEDVTIEVTEGDNLLSAAIQAGVHINASCGGKGVCGTCKVKIEKGKVKSPFTDKISGEEYRQGIRLACQSTVLSDLVVTIPVESRLDNAIQAREREKSAGISVSGWKFNPPVSKYYLELPPATMDDNASDLFRLRYGLQKNSNLENWPVDFTAVRKLPAALREKDWKVTATALLDPEIADDKGINSCRIINVEPGDTRGSLYALAIDVGTTTVCAQLLDLNRGNILAETINFNRQISYGSDVISRIAHCQQSDGLPKLQEMVVASINEAIDNLLGQSRIERNSISYITVAGNTTMEHLLLGLDPKYIRLAPYTPVANVFPMVKAQTLGIEVAEHVYVYCFPAVSSYVGGDIVSGVIAAGIYQNDKLTFYMDIGTNGEIVIGNSDWMVSTSCSAGPAFEGGGIKHGMVAMSGAIQDFSIDPVTLEPSIKTIQDARPRGICGSGLISAIAEMLVRGVISPNGKFNTHLDTKRIRQGADGYEYVLSWAEETQTGKDIVITEVDIDNLIRAKAAMYAGCQTLARKVYVSNSDFEQVILAGNFGSSLDIEKAVTIGLLPDIPRDRFHFIGNGSLSGARLAAYSSDILRDSLKVSRMMTNVELSDNNDFTDNYIAALFLPHTDEKLFPSVSGRIKGSGK